MGVGQGVVYLSQFQDAGGTYAGDLSVKNLALRGYGNLRIHFPFIGNHSFTPAWTVPLPYLAYLVVGYGLFALVVGGLVLELRRGWLVAEVFTMLSIGIAVFWPFMEDRFVLPVLPLACFYLFRALEWGLGRIPKPRLASWALSGLIFLVLLCQGYLVARYAADRFADGRAPKTPVEVEGYGTWDSPVINWAKYDVRFIDVDKALLQYMRNYFIINRVTAELVPEGSVIMSRKPMFTYFFSGRESVHILKNPAPDRQWEYIEDQDVDYIIMSFKKSTLLPMLLRWPERFEVVAGISPGDARLLKVVKKEGRR